MGSPATLQAARALSAAAPAGAQVAIAPSERCANASRPGILSRVTGRGLLSNSLCRLRPQLSLPKYVVTCSLSV